MSRRLHLEDDQMCYVCGKKNEQGFRLDFSHPAKNHLQAVVVFKKEHQGFKGIVHGGILGMFLDEMMVNLAWKEGYPAVTGELKVRLKKPARTGERVHFDGFIDRKAGKLLYARAEAKDDAGVLIASASATCVLIDPPKP